MLKRAIAIFALVVLGAIGSFLLLAPSRSSNDSFLSPAPSKRTEDVAMLCGPFYSLVRKGFLQLCAPKATYVDMYDYLYLEIRSAEPAAVDVYMSNGRAFSLVQMANRADRSLCPQKVQCYRATMQATRVNVTTATAVVRTASGKSAMIGSDLIRVSRDR